MNYTAPADLFVGKTLLVTGASDGIGREAALSYARHGANLLLLGRNQAKLDTVAQEIQHLTGRKAFTFTLDLATAQPDDCQRLVGDITTVTPILDGVLHNAGVLGKIMPLETTPPAVWQEVMRVNLDSTFFLTQALLPLLHQSSSASLIFTTSSVGRQGRAGWGAYAVSKFATEGMVQVFAEEFAGSTIRVNCINPGGTRTQMRANAYPDEDSSKLKTPADIMPLYLWLMGRESQEANGQSFDAQPGRKAGPAK